MALTVAQRTDVERHVSILEKACKTGPVERVGAALAGILSAFPQQQASNEEQMARASMYQIALDDLPAWAVERGVKMWMRRENPEGRENYAFAPSPPQLRRLAWVAFGKVKGELQVLSRLLAAQVDPELSSEQRAASLARLQQIVNSGAGAH